MQTDRGSLPSPPSLPLRSPPSPRRSALPSPPELPRPPRAGTTQPRSGQRRLRRGPPRRVSSSAPRRSPASKVQVTRIRGCPGPGANRCGTWGTPRTDVGIPEEHPQVMDELESLGRRGGVGGCVTWVSGDCAATHSAHLRAAPAVPFSALAAPLGILPDSLRSREVPLGNRKANVSAPSPRVLGRTAQPLTPVKGRLYPAKQRRGLSMGGGSGLSQAGFMNGERPAHWLSDPWRPSGRIAAPGIPGDLARGS